MVVRTVRPSSASSSRPGADPIATRDELNKALAGRGEVITRDEFEAREKTYWSRETPVGYITDLGFVMGLMIGMVFIYYAQYQIIRFYLPEYAILKSLGYDWWFFLCMIGQIGAAIITPAFLVAFTLARIVYGVAEATIHLGMTMGLREMVVALVASIIMTAVSSVFAIRRLWKVDPDHAVRVTMVRYPRSLARRSSRRSTSITTTARARSGSTCCSTSTCRSARASW